MIEQRFDVFACLSGNESDGAVSHRRKGFANVSHPAFGRHLAGQLIPFVDNENAWFEVVGNVMSELLIDLAHLLLAVEKHQHHVRSANAALGSVHPVPIDIRLDALVAP